MNIIIFFLRSVAILEESRELSEAREDAQETLGISGDPTMDSG
jgi:hypothetical protein